MARECANELQTRADEGNEGRTKEGEKRSVEREEMKEGKRRSEGKRREAREKETKKKGGGVVEAGLESCRFRLSSPLLLPYTSLRYMFMYMCLIRSLSLTSAADDDDTASHTRTVHAYV